MRYAHPRTGLPIADIRISQVSVKFHSLALQEPECMLGGLQLSQTRAFDFLGLALGLQLPLHGLHRRGDTLIPRHPKEPKVAEEQL